MQETKSDKRESYPLGARLPVSRPWLPFIDKSTNLMPLEQLS
jgi:hypothetical protein